MDDGARWKCKTWLLSHNNWHCVLVPPPPIFHSKRTNNRSSSSKIDVDNYVNLQTLYANIKNKLHIILANDTPPSQLLEATHRLYLLFVVVVAQLFLLLFWLIPLFGSMYCSSLLSSFRYFIVFRVLSQRHTHIHITHTNSHTIYLFIRWLIVDACVANILCLPLNPLRMVRKRRLFEKL